MPGLGMDETRLRRAFLEEAEELSQKLGDTLLALETDVANAGLINEVFRFTHSLKSESALMGFAVLSKLAHRMEDVLGLTREGKLPLEKPVMDALFKGADLIAEMMSAIGKGGSDGDFDIGGLMVELSKAMGAGAAGEVGPLAPTLAAPPPNCRAACQKSCSESSREISCGKRAIAGRRPIVSRSWWMRRNR